LANVPDVILLVARLGILAVPKVPLVILEAARLGISLADNPSSRIFISARLAVIPKFVSALLCCVADNP
jgi:hypothetical protein